MLADLQVQQAQQAPDEQLQQAVQQAQAAAAGLYQESVQAYQQVIVAQVAVRADVSWPPRAARC